MKLATLLFAIVLLLAACGSDDGGSTDDIGSSGTLDGSWTLDSGTVDGQAVTVLSDYPITLVTEGTEVGGRAACNSYGGTVSVDGSTIKITEVFMTEMACEPQVMESEQAYLQALTLVDTVVVDADALTLTGGGAELVFVRDAPVEDTALVGVVWTLDTLIEGDTATSTLGDPATLELRSDGTVSASTGCRELTGEYVVNGSEIVVTSAEMSGECPAELQSQDNLVVTVLTDGFTTEIEGNRLTLASQGGDGLSYTSEVEG